MARARKKNKWTCPSEQDRFIRQELKRLWEPAERNVMCLGPKEKTDHHEQHRRSNMPKACSKNGR